MSPGDNVSTQHMSGVCIRLCASLCVGHESAISKAYVRASTGLHLKPFLSQVNWLLHFFDCTALGPTVILRDLTCLDKGLETGGLVMYKVL